MEQNSYLNTLFKDFTSLLDSENDFSIIENALREIHFELIRRDLFNIPNREKEIIDDYTVLSKIGFYFITKIADKKSNLFANTAIKNQALELAGFCFEMLSKSSAINEALHWEYSLLSGISYSLSEKQANAIVMANSALGLYHSENIAINCMLYFIARRFKDIRKMHIPTQAEKDVITVLTSIKHFADSMLYRNSRKDEIEKLREAYERLYMTGSSLFYYLRLIYLVAIEMDRGAIRNLLSSHPNLEPYISVLTQIDTKNVYELWASQLFLLHPDNSLLSNDDRIPLVSMPTSAGKTLIAELAIFNVLSQNSGLAIYVVPSIALTNEIENNFFKRFHKVGIKVRKEIPDTEEVDTDTLLAESTILVLTPEKLDLLIRKRPVLMSTIQIIVFDEFHKVSANERGWLLETLIAWFILFKGEYKYKVVLMSAILSHVNKCIDNSLIDIIYSDWTPTRKLYGLYYLPIKSQIIYAKSKVKKQSIIKEPYNLCLRYNSKNKDIAHIFNKVSYGKKTVDGVDATKSDTKYDLCWRAIIGLSERPVLIYFFAKKDIKSFIKRAPKYLSPDNNVELNNLITTVQKQLGKDHLLCKYLNFGIGFHTGDLPEDVRASIENAYKNGVIKILACTTTLADGINLPVSTFIVGSYMSNNNYISDSDYKNIIGRIGRALIDTEGKIFLIRPPECYTVTDKKTLNRFVFPEKIETPLKSTLDNILPSDVESIINCLEDAELDGTLTIRELALNVLDRIQVFIFSVYETAADTTFDAFWEQYKNCFFINVKETGSLFLTAAARKYFYSAVRINAELLSKYNKTGLSYRSNLKLSDIATNIPVSFDLDEIISEEIFNNIITCKEFKPSIATINHFAIFKSWISGEAYYSIREKYFAEYNNEDATQKCTAYIREMFQYKLPWAFSSLLVFCGNFVSSLIGTLPQEIKYGTTNLNAIELCVGGINSRELSIAIANAYDNDLDKEAGGIEEWLVTLPQDKLKTILDKSFDYISLSQVSKYRSVRRTKTFEIKKTGYLDCNIAGLFYYKFQDAYNNNALNISSIVLLEQDVKNSYDIYAVKVFTSDHQYHLGYVPAQYSEEIFDLLESEMNVYAVVQFISAYKLSIKILCK
ncbi:MAG: DEAD/DEAH box helicase [Eubacteriales bacterium]